MKPAQQITEAQIAIADTEWQRMLAVMQTPCSDAFKERLLYKLYPQLWGADAAFARAKLEVVNKPSDPAWGNGSGHVAKTTAPANYKAKSAVEESKVTIKKPAVSFGDIEKPAVVESKKPVEKPLPEIDNAPTPLAIGGVSNKAALQADGTFLEPDGRRWCTANWVADKVKISRNNVWAFEKQYALKRYSTNQAVNDMRKHGILYDVAQVEIAIRLRNQKKGF